jgi:hypothetical protein
MSFRMDKYDADKFTEGEWSTIEGGEFKIARMNNSVYRAAQRRLDKEFRKKYGDELTVEQEDEKEAKLVAEGLLRDWSGIEAKDADGNVVPVPYSLENVATLLRNRPDVIPKIAQKAVDLERFESAEVEEQAGKRKNLSGGKRSSSETDKA